MITPYVNEVGHALGGVLDLLIRLAMPLSVGLGLVVIAGAVALARQQDTSWLGRADWRRFSGTAAGYMAVGLLVIAGWAALHTALPLAKDAIQWREAAEATTNPVPDAPAVNQYGPVAAAIRERTYTRTLTLPPDFMQRVGEQGVGVLAPYLSDPSAQNVLKLVDNFRRSGSDVIFTREVTRLDEEPIPFSDSRVRVRFKRLPGRAYDAEFEGSYVFENATPEPIKARFQFSLPQAGTIRDLNLMVGGQPVTEPGRSGAYEWEGQLDPKERREAVVRYRALGARSWQYDMGSQRRRVQHFSLDAAAAGPVRFMRGSLQPSAGARGSLHWDLTNVVTAQQVALAFPRDVVGRDSYLQALSALPASLLLFLVGTLLIGALLRQLPGPAPLAAALALFTFGLAASAVLANYLGGPAGILLGPLAGAALGRG